MSLLQFPDSTAIGANDSPILMHRHDESCRVVLNLTPFGLGEHGAAQLLRKAAPNLSSLLLVTRVGPCKAQLPGRGWGVDWKESSSSSALLSDPCQAAPPASLSGQGLVVASVALSLSGLSHCPSSPFSTAARSWLLRMRGMRACVRVGFPNKQTAATCWAARIVRVNSLPLPAQEARKIASYYMYMCT